jgi:sugar O-acyltransferase (sialic acid O-acetyltransferase NeuD family)
MGQQQLILIGGGGHCKSCIEVINSTGIYAIAGILDVKEKVGTTVLGYQVIGEDQELDRFPNSEYHFLVTVGQVKSVLVRKNIFERLKAANKTLATIISAHAVVSKYSTIGAGSVIMHGAKVNAGAVIGENCIINTNANVEHDCQVGNHVHVSTNAVLNGDCIVNDGAFIGSNSVLVQGVKIGAGVVIGAGSVVNRAVLEPGIYAGNPCRKIVK